MLNLALPLQSPASGLELTSSDLAIQEASGSNVPYSPKFWGPEKTVPKDAVAKFTEIGIPEEWVPVVQKAGYNLVSNMKEVNPQKLHMDICGINKKYKLNLTNPSVADVQAWIEKI